jgi:hypothetical protein
MSNNFNPGFDREKAAFLELANRGDGLTPIEYLYAEEARFGSVLSSVITGGTAEFYTIYVNGIESSSITTNSLKWSNSFNDYYVGFTAGSLTQSTIWSLPLQDGGNGQVLATNGNGVLSFIDAGGGGGGAPTDATYILQTSDSSLPNAQALNGLGTGIAKITGGGIVEIATPDVDYATVATLEEIANEAQESADSASNSANGAATSADNAASSETNALSSANSASSSASNALSSANSASSSASDALSSANSASGSASDALSSANSASGSASNALSSANSASGSASEATGYAAAAAGSAVLAASSAAIAHGAASTAISSAASASASASSASSSASSVGKDADKASRKASQAADSADDASDSANSASNSANQAEEYLNTLLETGLNELPCSGDVSLNNYKLINVATPELPTDGPNKDYIDTNFVKGKAYANANNLYIGEEAGNDALLATNNLGIGYLALYNIVSGEYNIAIGSASLTSLTTGLHNTAVGMFSLYSTTTGHNNLSLGGYALYTNSTGARNVAVGYQAGYDYNNNDNCTFLGCYSGVAPGFITGLTNATAIGYNSKISISNAIRLGNGCYVGINQASPTYPLHISNVNGICALYLENTENNPNAPTTGGLLYITGNELYYKNNNKEVALTSVSGVIAGEYILPTLTVNAQGKIITATSNGIVIASNFFIGQEAGNDTLTGDLNLGYGTQSLQYLTTGDGNVGIGWRSLRYTNTGSRNVAVGVYSLISNNSGDDNTAIGYDSLGSNDTGDYNTAIGSTALHTNQTGNNNTAVGYRALLVNNVNGCTAIGSRCLADNVIGTANTGVGTYALQNNVAGNNNTGIGYNALNSNRDTGNTALGAYSLPLATTGGLNTALGTYSLNQNITGISNVAVGYQSGDSFASNNNCVFLGAYSDSSVNGLTNAIAIGYNSVIGISNAIRLGNGCYVGINQASPTYPLHISNVNGICALYLENTENNPNAPTTGGLLYIRGNELYYKNNNKTLQLTTSLTDGQLLIGSTGAAPVAAVPTNGTNISWTTGAGSLTANITGQIGLSNGGTNANLTASNGGIVYSTASALAILSGTATAGRMLRSGASAAPSWSTATYPATTTANQILYSSAANTITGLATANSRILSTNASGVPSLTTTLPFTVPVTTGGTGLTSTTAYGVLCGGTTNTGALQNVGTGTSGQVYVSNGAYALGTWKSNIIDDGSNFYIGYGAGNANTIQAINNTSVGINALSENTGNYNVAVGYFSLVNNNSGSKNIAIGASALLANTTGSYNTAIGDNALLCKHNRII